MAMKYTHSGVNSRGEVYWWQCSTCHTCSPSRSMSEPPACLGQQCPEAAKARLAATVAREGTESTGPATQTPVGPESLLQRDCERWLQAHGWWPRSGKWLSSDLGQSPAGWYVHLHQCRENPCILDLLLLANDGRYLEIELKTATGKATKEQAIILNGRAPVRDCQTFAQCVTMWRERLSNE